MAGGLRDSISYILSPSESVSVTEHTHSEQQLHYPLPFKGTGTRSVWLHGCAMSYTHQRP